MSTPTGSPAEPPPAPLRWTRDPREAGWSGSAVALGRDLEAAVPGGVRFDAGHRAMYAVDASNYRQVPIGVVFPRSAEQVEAAVAVCRHHGAPVLGRGGGTSLAGQCCNHAVVFDFSRHMGRVLEIDPAARRARVEPGCVLDTLRDRAVRDHGLTFAPDPATHSQCTLGGMIGNNSCGPHSVMGGRTADNVESLEILTYDGLRMTVGATSEEELEALIAGGGRRGEIYRRLRALRDRYEPEIRQRFGDLPRLVAGYNLKDLLPERGFHVARALVGSESTCVTVLAATLRLVPWPAARVLLAVSYEDVYLAADHVPEVMAERPMACEGMDGRIVAVQREKKLHPEDLALLPDGDGWLLVELGADAEEEAAARAERLAARLRVSPHVVSAKIYRDPAVQQKVWTIRESALGAAARQERDTWPGWEDSAVPPHRLGDYLRDLRRLLDSHGLHGAFYGHFGEGCVHTHNDFDLRTTAGLAGFRAFMEEAADLCVSYGGSLSGEHGDGQARGELLPRQFGDALCRAFREFKGIWDPDGRMNPGKLVDPYPLDTQLRLGTGYQPKPAQTWYDFPDDDRSFARATLRCVGVGKCRREDGGTMCPSYQVTHEERHSTRGRAHLLHEMMTGELVGEMWRSEEVKEALDLCLACKGCKRDCPAGVDVASYKAEFLAHYYRHARRPRSAYAMGLVHWWARAGARAPALANRLAASPPLAAAAKALAGVAPERELPALARRDFRRLLRAHRSGNGTAAAPAGAARRVVLFPDTFNTFFHPEVAMATLDTLERAGWKVAVPQKVLCCGRPLYDHGFLGRAEKLLVRVLDTLAPEIDAGVPMVVPEPSCCAVFRDELPNLLSADPRAHRLAAQTFTLAELLADHTPDWRPPPLAGRALFHGHCHQKSVIGQRADLEVLSRLGLEVAAPETGCCGMAGSFGFEKEKYDVSMACGERVLLPAVRRAAAGTLLVTDGFSCREQVRQATGREPLHLAEVLHRAYREGDGGAGPAA
ncbi:MAG TPA: FAD-binding and (Fe-S)-binding domain-containing protein [Thermoanaerobaculia bacterium]|nr:FAD-binding and (Fe-S)-binding domain-containing protein [Thermoanaerobaculia bacterium]